MSIRNTIRLLLPCLLAVLWSSSAYAVESRPASAASSRCVAFDFDGNRIPDTSLTQVDSVGSDEDPGNLDDPSPDALVPHCCLPTIIKASDSLPLEEQSVPFSDQSSAATLRGPPLPL